MPSESFILRTTFDTLVDWINRYAVLNPPPGCSVLQLDPSPQPFDWDDETRTMLATIYKLAPFGRRDPLFEFSAVESDGICAVNMQCLEPLIESWFCEMIERMAPNRASGRAQPLPELPPGPLERQKPSSHAPGAPSSAPLQSQKPTTKRPPKPPQESQSSHDVRKGATRGGRKSGTRNTPVEEQERYCEEYLRLHLKNGMKLRTYISERHLPQSTFCDWLKHYRQRHPNWEAKARASS